jgi:hypothetical protein
MSQGKHAQLRFYAFSEYIIELIDALLSNIEKKSQLYVKSNKLNLSTIFLLNNYHFIYRSIKVNNKLALILGNDCEEKLGTLVAKQKEVYITRYAYYLEFKSDYTQLETTL